MLKHPVSVLLTVIASGILVNAVIATVMSNLSTGIWLTYALGGAILAGGLLFHRLPLWLPIAAGSALLVLAICVSSLFLFGKHDTVTYTEDAVIVLGAGIKGDKPTKSLQNRLDRAVAYHKQNPDAVILVSGGKGPQETITEAEAMARYLIAQGVPKTAIVQENAATSTTENFELSLPMMDKHATVAFITTDYHIFRAAQNAARVNLHATHAHAPPLHGT